MATATAKKNMKRRTKKVQSPIAKFNTEALTVTEELIDGTIATGEKWQKLFTKSLKKSEPIMTKNMDVAFDTIESVVEQFQNTSNRVKSLFGYKVKTTKKTDAKKTVVVAKKVVKKVTKKATTTAKKATTVAKKAVPAAKKATPTAKKATPTVKKTAAVAKKATATVKKTPTKVDVTNLKLISGIGPKMEELLKKEGYNNLQAVAKASLVDLRKVLDTADARYRLLNPESWISDAKAAIK